MLFKISAKIIRLWRWRIPYGDRKCHGKQHKITQYMTRDDRRELTITRDHFHSLHVPIVTSLATCPDYIERFANARARTWSFCAASGSRRRTQGHDQGGSAVAATRRRRQRLSYTSLDRARACISHRLTDYHIRLLALWSWSSLSSAKRSCPSVGFCFETDLKHLETHWRMTERRCYSLRLRTRV